MESDRFNPRRAAAIRSGIVKPTIMENAIYTHYINANPRTVYDSCKQLWGKESVDWTITILDVDVCIVTVYTSEHSMWLKLRWDHWN